MVAAAAVTAMTVPAVSIEIDQLIGRWSSSELDECQYADDSEGAPLQIRQQDGETLIGNYGWLCGVTNWKTEDGFLVGSAKDCGMEGGDDTFDENFVLGLNSEDELLMAKDATAGLRRCPVMQ
jgi:hypothetical protein